jgi:hypothetical protein
MIVILKEIAFPSTLKMNQNDPFIEFQLEKNHVERSTQRMD